MWQDWVQRHVRQPAQDREWVEQEWRHCWAVARYPCCLGGVPQYYSQPAVGEEGRLLPQAVALGALGREVRYYVGQVLCPQQSVLWGCAGRSGSCLDWPCWIFCLPNNQGTHFFFNGSGCVCSRCWFGLHGISTRGLVVALPQFLA